MRSEKAYRFWFLKLCGILGDPVTAKKTLNAANARGEKLKGNGYGYKQAYKNSPASSDLSLLHEILVDTWGELPSVIDPTAGGGSIPYEAIRYGLPTIANDLNPIAVAVLRAGVGLPARYGPALLDELRKWGRVLVERVEQRVALAFRRDDKAEDVIAYIFARTIACPRTGKSVPLSPNWWLSKQGKGVAVRLITHRDGRELAEPEFEICTGELINFDPNKGTVAGGDGVSPWDGLVIDGDYIKSESQAGRMGSVPYAVSIRTEGKRAFRAPTDTDLEALKAAVSELARLHDSWQASDTVPSEERFLGPADRSANYGIRRHKDLFEPPWV